MTTTTTWWLCVVVVVVATVVTTVAALDEEMAELAAMVRDTCAGETGVDLALVDGVNGGAELAATPEPTLKCYIKCCMEMAGMLSEGEVDTEAVVALMPPEMAAHCADGIRACGTKRGSDHCDTAFLTQVCWQTYNKEQFFLI